MEEDHNFHTYESHKEEKEVTSKARQKVSENIMDEDFHKNYTRNFNPSRPKDKGFTRFKT